MNNIEIKEMGIAFKISWLNGSGCEKIHYEVSNGSYNWSVRKKLGRRHEVGMLQGDAAIA